RIHWSAVGPQPADDVGDQVHDVGIALHGHQLGDLDASNLTDAPQVVTAQVDEHHVLGAFLFAGPEFLLHTLIGRIIAATAPGARDRPVAELASLHGHQNFGRRAQDGSG